MKTKITSRVWVIILFIVMLIGCSRSSSKVDLLLDQLSAELDAAYEEAGRPAPTFESMDQVKDRVDLMKFATLPPLVKTARIKL